MKIDEEIPQWRDFHSATNLDNRMYIFGGRFDQMGPEHTQENFYDNRLHVFDPQENFWSLVSVKGDVPCGRRSHSACSLPFPLSNSPIFPFLLVAYSGKLYIFAGYNNVLGYHFNDLHEFDPLTSTWRRVRTSGISNPVPRRRQCCLVITDRMYMFGGTSPVSGTTFPDHLHRVQDIAGSAGRLNDQNDLYIFDFVPTLKTLCFLSLAQEGIDQENLPESFRREYQIFFQSNLNRPRSIEISRRA